MDATITVTKAERGYVDADGNIYSEKQVIFNRKNFTIEDQQPKTAKSSRKSSYAPKGNWNAGDIAKEILTNTLMGVQR